MIFFPNHHFHLGLLSEGDPPAPHYETLPKCFNQSKKLWLWKNTSLPMIYFIKYSRGGFGKIWIRKFIYVIFHIFYRIIFACIARIWRGNIASHCTTTIICLDFRKLIKREPNYSCWLSKLKTSWSACARISSEPITATFWQVACSRITKWLDVFNWSI